MIRALNSRERRIVALGLLVVVVLALYAVVVWPLVSLYAGYDDRIEELNHRLAQYRRIAAAAPSIRQALTELQRRQPTSSYYLRSETPALALADLQQYVGAVIGRSNGRLVSSQVSSEDAGEPFPRATVKVNMQGSVESVRDVFHALESGRPMAFIDDVSINASRARMPRRGAKVPGQGNLNIRFAVVVYLQTGAAG